MASTFDNSGLLVVSLVAFQTAPSVRKSGPQQSSTPHAIA